MTITSGTIRKAAEKARERQGDTAGTVINAVETLGVDTSDYSYIADALADGLDRVADAMDGMVPLPVGADGEPIRVGDVVYATDDNRLCHVEAVGRGLVLLDTSFGDIKMLSESVTHERPDSFERIIRDAYDLGGWSEEMVGDGPDYSVEDLVERCRRLAGEES
nr:hypothetical protein [uncultured Olsenella sp.]